MAIFKCKMCGGTVEFEQGASIGVCDSCGTKQTLPKVSDDTLANLFNRANNLRLKCEFDKAAAIYEKIVEQDDTEAEAHWGIVLCKYGIEYVDDPATGKKIPTCHRTLFDAVTADADYQAAIDYSDTMQQALYETEARAIDRIQKDILAIVKNEKPFDVFICYKETDENGKRTQDSVIANDIYYQLTQEGFKVFYAAITLEDKLGQEYEPYIFAALNSAKVMLVVGTDPLYFNAVWVRNEWSRYLKLMKTDRNKLLIPCYRDMDAYELPEEFAHLQAQDMSKIGFINDVVRGIKKVISTDTPTPAMETVVVNTASANTAPLLERAFMFLEDGAWQDADSYCEKVLDIDPKNAQAYLGKLMAELQVKKREELKNCAQPFDDRNNYQKALRFADPALADGLKADITYINERSFSDIYARAVHAMDTADSEEAYSIASNMFESIKNYKDAAALAEKCFEKAEACGNEDIYNSAKAFMTDNTVYSYEKAIELLQRIPGWKNADELIGICRNSKEKKKEEDAIKRKKNAKTALIVLCILVALCALGVLLVLVIIPSSKYNAAVKQMNAGEYDEAITAFENIHKDYYYRDSDVQIANCKNAIIEADNADRYDRAMALKNEGQYGDAMGEFYKIKDYKDSKEQVKACLTALKDIDYDAAVALMDDGKYEEAITAFEAMDGYKDSTAQIVECRYNSTVALMNNGKFEEAIAAFEAMEGYKDCENQIENCYIGKYGEEKWNEIKSIKVGDTYIFGAYEQGNDKSNGKEDIEWLVLAKEGSKILVISDKVLDCQPYNTKRTDVTWETCSLREWLNSTFLDNAFSAEEQVQIASTTVTADKNPYYSTDPGKATTDQVFVLSATEAEKYFKTDEDRKCAPTAYAKTNGASTSSDNCWWWLRSPGRDWGTAASVGAGGSVRYNGSSIEHENGCVRPAMWIDLGN